jgi:hypothetical protein
MHLKHVPEEDTRVQEERLRRRGQSSGLAGVFGSSGLSTHDALVDRIAYLREQNIRSREYLAKLDPSDLEHKAVLEEIDRKEKLLIELDAEKGNGLIADFKYLAKDLAAYFSRPFADPEKTAFVRERLRELFLCPEVAEKMENLFGEGLGNFTPAAVMEKVQSGELDVDTMLVIARKNGELTKYDAEKFHELCEGFRNEFKDAVIHAVREEKLPPDTLSNLARVDSVHFQFRDTMDMVAYSAEGSAGAHGSINASGMNLRRPERLRHTVFHELMHEIAGKTLSLRITSDEKRGDTHDVNTERSGLVFSGSRHGMWINEALTEKLALMLSGYQSDNSEQYEGSPFYQDERREVDRLLDFAESRKDELWATMLKAYFENVRSDQQSMGKAKGFAELVQKINRNILPELRLPLTANKDEAMQHAAGRKVYQILLAYGKNTKARATDVFYYVPVSEEMLTSDADELRTARRKYNGFAHSEIVPV